MDFNKYAEVIDELLAIVVADRRLAGFVPHVTELRNQARVVALGGKDIPPLPRLPKRTIPDRATAHMLLAKINEIPFCDPAKENPDALRSFYGLSRNLVNGIMHEIIEDFPDLVSTPAGDVPK